MSLLSVIDRLIGRRAGLRTRQPLCRSHLQLETLEDRLALSPLSPPTPPNSVVYPISLPNFSEIAMAVNPRNQNDIIIFGTVAHQPLPGRMGIFTSLNGGKTWATIVVDANFDGGLDDANRADPAITFDAAGRAHIAYLIALFDGTVSAIETASSIDGGMHWTAVPARIDPGTTVFLNDKETIAAAPPEAGSNPNLLVIGYTRFNNDVAGTSVPEVIASTDGGQTWSDPGQVNPPVGGNDFVQFCQPQIGPHNEIYISFVKASFDPTTGLVNSESIFFRSATFANDTFTFGPALLAAHVNSPQSHSPIPAQPHRGIGSIPVLAVDDSHSKYRGSIYITYPDGPVGADAAQLNIQVVHSRGIGQSFSKPVKVNHDTIGASHFNPWIVVDQTNGSIGVEWRDTRLDPNDERVNVFSAFSRNGGNSFGFNYRISSAPSDDHAAPGEPNDFLEYDGFAVQRGEAYYAWSDNRNNLNGFKRIFFAKMPTGINPLGSPSSGGRSNVRLADDRFEPNDTSSMATVLGVLHAGTETIGGLTINIHANGVPDNDWFRWTIGASGTFSATINYTPLNGGDLDLRVYALNSSGQLVQLGAGIQRGVKSQHVTVHVTAGEQIYAWIYGFNHEQGDYSLTATLS
jgi:hypothetical protein